MRSTCIAVALLVAAVLLSLLQAQATPGTPGTPGAAGATGATGTPGTSGNRPAALADTGKFVDLFDGKTLTGWKIITCEAEVQDGCIFLKGGNGIVRTERTYKDYVLEVDWKALKADNWDSGVFFRCGDPPKDYPWPRTYQSNLRKGDEGNVEELKDARSKGLTKPHEWNHFKLTVTGTKAELEINGQPAWKADGVTTREGYIGLQAEIPGGGQFLFRNVRVMELESKP